MLHRPGLKEAREYLRYLISEAREFDIRREAGEVGTVDVARASIRRAWDEYCRATRAVYRKDDDE